MDDRRFDLLRPTTVPLHLSVNVVDDWIEGVEYGSVVDGRPDSQLVEVTPEVRYVLRAPGAPVIGFTVHDYSSVEIDGLGIFGPPRFSVPTLALDQVSLGEIVCAVRSRFEVSTADVCFFTLALASAEEEDDLPAAADHWMSCIEAGDQRGHFGRGYTLYDLGRHREAYGHLRHYAEIAAHNSWAWLWFGRAAEAVGEYDEARRAYERAIRREREGSFRTDAHDRLRTLERRRGGASTSGV